MSLASEIVTDPTTLVRYKYSSTTACIRIAMSKQEASSSMGGGGEGGGEGEGGEAAKRTKQQEAMEANRAYQATRLYSRPPVFAERDERRETHDYGLIHMVSTITKLRCFEAIVHLLQPREAARLQQTRKIFVMPVEAAEEQVVMHMHKQHFALASLPSTIGRAAAAEVVAAAGGGGGGEEGGEGTSFTRYLHELSTNKSHKVLLMGGVGMSGGMPNQVGMMIIDLVI